MAPERVTILVDHRERAPDVCDALTRLEVRVEHADLPVGDYIVAERVGVERKTVKDLHRSIVNRRLWRQIASLRVDLSHAYLVVEGVDLDAGPVSRVGVRSALLAVGELGVVVIRSRNPSDTAMWLSRIAARRQSRKPRRVARSVPHGRRATPESLLSALPGISSPVARNLLYRFGSVAGVASATRSELLQVAGIGDKRADTLVRLLANQRPNPR